MISRRERWSYAAGDLGFNFVWQSIELYLLFYYIRVLGLTPAIAAGIFLAGAAVDWMIDPVVGAWADRAAPRRPLRHWVLVGGPLSVLMLSLAFEPLPLAPAWVPVGALITYLGLRAAYGLGNIPYGALTARISALPSDHLALTSARMQGAAIGGLIAALVYAMLPADAVGAEFRHGAQLLAIFALPAFLVTFVGVRERVQPPAPPADAHDRGIWRAALFYAGLLRQSASLRRLIAAIIASGLSITVVNKSLLFLFEEIGAPRLGFYVALVPAAALLLTTPLWAMLGARLGQSQTLLLAALAQAAATVLAVIAGEVAAVVVLTCVAIVAGCGMSVMFWSLVPVAVADCERYAANGGCVGRVYALSNIARKLAQAFAPTVVALTLVGAAGSTLAGMCASALAAVAILVVYRPHDGDQGQAPPTRTLYSGQPTKAALDVKGDWR
ncbi:MAG: sugar transporter [Sphingomonas sp. 28-66-16]|nr:MAG: sugar transporter [Sphingomonas sp. 28-66-16]